MPPASKKKPTFTEENLQLAEDAAAWTDVPGACDVCMRDTAEFYLVLPDEQRICSECLISVLQSNADREDLARFSPAQFKEALSPRGDMRRRLTVLRRFQDVQRRSLTGSSTDLNQLRKLLIANLGYAAPHPLRQTVRQVAFEACLKSGRILLPLLLKATPESPEHQINIFLAAANIAPEDKRVWKLLEKAARSDHPEVQRRAIRIIENLPSWEGRELLDELMRDESVKTSVKRLIPLASTLNRMYRADDLKRMHKRYLHHFCDDRIPANKLRKANLIDILDRIYSNKHLFERLLACLPEATRRILNFMVWEGGRHKAKALEKQFQTEILSSLKKKAGTRHPGKVHDDYLIFEIELTEIFSGIKWQHEYTLSLPYELRTLFKSYLPPPAGYDIIPQDTVEPTEFRYTNNDRIINHITLLLNYLRQGNLKFSKSGDKVLVSSLKNMRKYCDIQEFYKDGPKEVALLRTQLIADLLMEAEAVETEGLEFFRQLLADFFEFKKFKHYRCIEQLQFLKGTQHIYNDKKREQYFRKIFLNILKALPQERWVSVENIIQYVWYRDIDLEIIDKHDAEYYVYFKGNPADKSERLYHGYYSDRIHVYEDIYKDVIIAPLIKFMMFLCGAFGLVDIACNLPENKIHRQKNKPYLSVFDGLKHIRLTALGAYVTGQTANHSTAVKKETARLILNDKRLIITLEGQNRLKKMVLEKIGEPISENRYKVDYGSFFKECTSKEEVEQKIQLFKKEISSRPPLAWRSFLNDIENRINPLLPEPAMKIFKLKPERELITLIAQDKVLKKYIVKAENYHIVIASKHLQQVKKRLQAFGYFIDGI